jgi:hypothetical protein
MQKYSLGQYVAEVSRFSEKLCGSYPEERTVRRWRSILGVEMDKTRKFWQDDLDMMRAFLIRVNELKSQGRKPFMKTIAQEIRDAYQAKQDSLT